MRSSAGPGDSIRESSRCARRCWATPRWSGAGPRARRCARFAAVGAQPRAQRTCVELCGFLPRAGDVADVGQHANVKRAKQRQELIERAHGAADREDVNAPPALHARHRELPAGGLAHAPCPASIPFSPQRAGDFHRNSVQRRTGPRSARQRITRTALDACGQFARSTVAQNRHEHGY
jgi:hypothetical protein